MKEGSRVKRKIRPDNNIGTIISINEWGCAKIRWDIVTVNTVTGARQQHSTINIKNLIDIDLAEPVTLPDEPKENSEYNLFNQPIK